MVAVTIPEFYSNKTIFITGGSGFIGKVLIEKLLRSCPHIEQIYLLMRPKKGKTEERIKEITDLPLFDLLRKNDPQQFDKLKAIPGDVRQLQLGLSDTDRQKLIDETDVVFHGAASVRFDDPLAESILLNTRGTRELVNLALQMKRIKAFVHISTTYCNSDRILIHEQLYPPHADWRQTIEIAEQANGTTLNVLTKKYMGDLPNTYTFAKSLAEHVVCDLGDGKLPIVIFRPSIVISTAQEPFPGWIDNFNGPVGLLVASGKGIVRSVYTRPDIISDYIPVDLVAKAIVITAWKKAHDSDISPSFYNASNNNTKPLTMAELVDLGRSLNAETPLNDILWHPYGGVTNCYYNHYLKVIFYHLLPAIVIDALLRVGGGKPLLLKVQRRIYAANMALQYFLRTQWTFTNTNTLALEQQLLPSDYEAFAFHRDSKYLVVEEYFKHAIFGARRYLLKEDDASLASARLHAKRMYWLFVVFNGLFYLVLGWFLFVKVDVLSLLARFVDWIYVYFTCE